MCESEAQSHLSQICVYYGVRRAPQLVIVLCVYFSVWTNNLIFIRKTDYRFIHANGKVRREPLQSSLP